MARSNARVIEIEERETRLFQRDDLFDIRGQSLVLPETRDLAAVELKDVQSGVALRAMGLIGYLPLTDKIVLNLRPKFPVGNLWRMLALADESYERVLPVLRSYESASASAPHQLLARGFCHYLTHIVDLGLARGYYREPYTGFFKPRIEFGKTVARHFARGDELNVSGTLFAFSANLPVNSLLKSACASFIRLIPRNPKWSKERKVLLEALNSLHRVRAAPMRYGEQALAEGVPQWIRDHYRGALSVYGMLLGYTRVGFGYHAQGSEMPSFLFSLDDIFESFIRNTLREGLRNANIAVVDGNKPKHQRPLFKDNTAFPIKPDAVMRRGKTVVGIGEMKYKPKIDESDRYQVISHSVALCAPIAFWISPSLTSHAAGMQYVGSIASGIKFYHYRLDISGDIDAARKQMVDSIQALLPA